MQTKEELSSYTLKEFGISVGWCLKAEVGCWQTNISSGYEPGGAQERAAFPELVRGDNKQTSPQIWMISAYQ